MIFPLNCQWNSIRKESRKWTWTNFVKLCEMTGHHRRSWPLILLLQVSKSGFGMGFCPKLRTLVKCYSRKSRNCKCRNLSKRSEYYRSCDTLSMWSRSINRREIYGGLKLSLFFMSRLTYRQVSSMNRLHSCAQFMCAIWYRTTKVMPLRINRLNGQVWSRSVFLMFIWCVNYCTRLCGRRAYADDIGFNINNTIYSSATADTFPYVLHVHSKGLFNTITTLHESKEYRLRETVQLIRKLYKPRDLDTTRWMQREANIYFALMKHNSVTHKLLSRIAANSFLNLWWNATNWGKATGFSNRFLGNAVELVAVIPKGCKYP